MLTLARHPSRPETLPHSSVAFRRASASNEGAIYDAGLVGRFKAGDESAFGTIVTRHRDLIFSVAFGVLKNHGDAEEIAQDTFLSAHRGLRGFRGDSSLATWLHRIALNLSRNRYWYFHRRCRHATVSIDSTLCERNQVTYSDLVTTGAICPSRDIMIGEFSDLVVSCMKSLRTKQREILQMQASQRYSYVEMAEKLNISIGTVKSRIARAREGLRVLLSEAYPECNASDGRVEWFDPVRRLGGIEVMSA